MGLFRLSPVSLLQNDKKQTTMKKTLLYSLAALVGLSFASCNGDYDDWTNPQGFGQENAITIPGFTATAAGDVNLANLVRT